MLQGKRNLCSGKRFLRHIEFLQLFHALQIAFLLCHQIFVFLLFGRQMLHHFIDFRKCVQILTSQFLAQTLIFFRFLSFVLNFALKLSAFCFPFLILFGDILRYFGNISIDFALVIPSE